MEIKRIIINEWQDLLALEPEGGGWVYRGHADTHWPLETSLSRTVAKNRKRYGHDESDILYAERASLRTFKSRAHFYLDNLPDADDAISWLSIMQHHGTPTRLLDFTQSLYVAIYFALIEAEGDSCVWAISDSWLREEGTKFAVNLGHSHDYRNGLRFGELKSMYSAGNYVINANKFGGNEDDFENPAVLLIELDKQIPRLAIQQGVFLLPTKAGISFKDNLAALEPDKYPHILKIEFPHSLREHALMHLRAMNITAETLFPGVDGFAKSLIHHDML